MINDRRLFTENRLRKVVYNRLRSFTDGGLFTKVVYKHLRFKQSSVNTCKQAFVDDSPHTTFRKQPFTECRLQSFTVVYGRWFAYGISFTSVYASNSGP